MRAGEREGERKGERDREREKEKEHAVSSITFFSLFLLDKHFVVLERLLVLGFTCTTLCTLPQCRAREVTFPCL